MLTTFSRFIVSQPQVVNLTVLCTYHRGLINNKVLPWSIDFLIHYEEKLDFEMLGLNSAVWDKAFKPFVDDKLIETVLRIL